ncbi:hypothetical protein Xcel_3462 (plasmid) [Xylanimonas cellulosilytica DSM 15894]|uniref:Uncharacterized protein n=1 Tax=Xylanimonas cellulosilytica (strain DSM 15894 / JCM 12276 / CECT 5975 / KCTC 9989 / LMG 20990 / NBRC 107835 / XIL07) TaxID=446471 RepID=D1C0Z5_XYLCX|nr:hypothetical protein [Xylanimonas cellulosilytica]ACZ32461.1 hypothetical protein Xcel_3462 [Xylanimonas cellulosilytica DSM 15894]
MTVTTARPLEPGIVAELDDILRTHRAQLFGHLARHAAHHNLSAADVADLLAENVDTVHDWLRWASEGPACTCTHGADGTIAVQHFDCPVHGDTLYRNQVRNRLAAA